MLWLQVELHKEPSQVCNAIIDVVVETKLEDILKIFEINFSCNHDLWQPKC